MNYPIGENETARLRLLAALGLRDRPAPASWDRLCRVAAKRFAVPFSAITLLAESAEYLKARCGFADDRTAREHAMCNWTILGDEVFTVADASRRREFRDNPLVVGEPRIRFYAGAPLVVAHGMRIGAFCIVGTEPRDLTRAESDILRNLARMAVDELWLEGLENGPALDPPRTAELYPDFALTVEQIRGARGILGWSVQHLAAAANVSPATVKRAESATHRPLVGHDMVDRIRIALEAAGIEFLFHPGESPGLRTARR